MDTLACTTHFDAGAVAEPIETYRTVEFAMGLSMVTGRIVAERELSTIFDNTNEMMPVRDKAQVVKVGDDDILYLGNSRAETANFREYLTRSMARLSRDISAQGHNIVRMIPLLTQLDKVEEYWSVYGSARFNTDFEWFQGQLIALSDRRKADFAKRLAIGAIANDDIPAYLEEGTEVFTMQGDDIIAGIVDEVEWHSSFFGPYYSAQLRLISNHGGTVSEAKVTVYQPALADVTPIKNLAIRRLSEEPEIRAKLIERGKIFAKCAETGYFAYVGNIDQPSYWNARVFRADGRVMLDPVSFRQSNSRIYGECVNASRLETDDNDPRRGSGSMVAVELTDADLWRTSPYVFGFSFRAKQWGRMRVTGLSEIKWREDAFDKLVLPDEKKNMVRALVENHGVSFNDVVDGKSGGCIFMLHGEPGQGKTLTAETVAELLRRPLYSVSIGELGTDPDQLEKRLREILDIATTWNAVLLLDEADVFLEARNENDILRNAMVGVFLRLLEYHQGVLFLTTNRVKNIDPAFYSRISIALRFDGADTGKRRAIWKNLLTAAGESIAVDDDVLDRLATHDINGRQIKNVIRLSQTLVLADGGDRVDETMLTKMIGHATSFQSELAA